MTAAPTTRSRCRERSRRTGRSCRCSRWRRTPARAPRCGSACSPPRASIASSVTPTSARRSRRSSGCAPALHGNCAVAIASRALPESQIDVHQPGKREVMGRTYNRLLRMAALHGPARHAVRFQGVHRRSRDRLLRAAAHPAIRVRRRGPASRAPARMDGRRGSGPLGAQGGLAGERNARFRRDSLRLGASTVHCPAIIAE